MIDLLEDLSSLTHVSAVTWKEMTKRSTSLISHYVVEAIQSDTDSTEVDLGIGVLHLKIDDDSVRFRFDPSRELTRKIQQAVDTGTSSLVLDVDEELGKRFSSTYKELV